MADSYAECNFDWGTPLLESLRIVDRLPSEARELVQQMGEAAYQRPEPKVWSANEYIWHLADTFRFSAEWIRDIRVRDHPTHYAVDNDALAPIRGYERLPVEVGLWSLEQSCRLFVGEAAITDPARSCYYHDYKDVTAGEVVSFLAHEAVHHLHDLRRLAGRQEKTNAG